MTKKPKKDNSQSAKKRKTSTSSKQTKQLTLVHALDWTATGILQSLMERLPRAGEMIHKVPEDFIYQNGMEADVRLPALDKWRLLFKAAGLGIAWGTKEVYRGEHKDIKVSIEGDDQLVAYINNFTDFQNLPESGEIAKKVRPEMPIGYWVVLNMENEKPENHDGIELASTIGGVVASTTISLRKELASGKPAK